MKFTCPPLFALAVAGLVASGFATQPQPRLDPHQASHSLTHDEMKATVGAGSTCRLGCNEPNITCTTVSPAGPNQSADMDQTWNPHYECGWAPGSDTCTAGQDMLCNTRTFYHGYWQCNLLHHRDFTYSSTCGPDLIPIEAGG